MEPEIEYRTESGSIRGRARRRLDVERATRLLAKASIIMLTIQALNLAIMGTLLLRQFYLFGKPVRGEGFIYVITSFSVSSIGTHLWRLSKKWRRPT